MAVKTKRFDPADYLDSDEALAEYVTTALETGDPAFIADSLGVVARAKGMAKVARQAGLGRESLYKALRAGGNPGFATVVRVMEALGLRLTAAAARSSAGRRRKRAARDR
ncbi:MAG: addiction module antidote protein [Pseudomonadota bacterium]